MNRPICFSMRRNDQQVPQQTGVLLKHRQQVQPASMHSHMQSQQA
jgi:hypothetical protein